MNNLIFRVVAAVLGAGLIYFILTAPRTATSPTTNRIDWGTTTQAQPDSVAVPSTVTPSQIEIYQGYSFPVDVQSVNLSGKGLTGSLMAEVRHLENLKVLDISNNAFTGLPAEVGQLYNLKTLNLSNNRLTGLPQELGNLSSLQILDLRGNNISTTDLQIIRSHLSPNTTILVD